MKLYGPKPEVDSRTLAEKEVDERYADVVRDVLGQEALEADEVS